MATQLPFGPDAVLLVGNLKVGKSTLFDAWVGRHRAHSVYPGTAVELAVGRTAGPQGHEVVDAPGCYALDERSEDSHVVRDLLAPRAPGPRLVGRVVLVLDAKNLRRGLVLAQEVAETGVPAVVALNMVDEARQRGLDVDPDALSRELGVPVVGTVATERHRTGALLRALASARPLRLRADWPGALAEARALADPALAEALRRRADEVVSRVVRARPPTRWAGWDRLAAWSRQPLTGLPIAAVVLGLVYLFVGRFGAGTLVDLIEGRLFVGWLLPAIEGLVSHLPWEWLRDLLVGDFGLLSVGLVLPLGVVLPVLATFFFAFALLVDSGYLPRLSLLLDRTLRRIGLNGKGLLPLVMGLSCVTMALLTTRVLDTRKQRVIASLLLVLAVPCAPLLAVMMVVLAQLPPSATVVVVAVLASQLLAVGWLADRALPGPRADLVLELPPLRAPRLANALVKSGHRVVWFLREAIPYFLLGTLLLYLLDRAGLIELLRRGLSPVSEVLLGLPPSAADIFLMTIVRREVGAALLAQQMADGAFDGVQAVVTLIVMTLMVPCVNTVLVLYKERGAAVATGVLAFVMTWALVVGALLRAACQGLGVTF